MRGFKANNYISHCGINEGRVVLHSDLNNFFASVASNENQSLKNVPLAVCGSKEERHGIVLAKNYIAKKYGIQTGQAIWQAQKLCPDLVCVKPDYDLYMEYSKRVKNIYSDYSCDVESFGIDEAWIELTGDINISCIDDGKKIAEEIRRRVKKETGLTVSVGVSDNKVFSKLASDYKKPDTVTVFGPDNYKSTVCKLDIRELLFIGKRTCEKLYKYGIHTIGQLAESDVSFLKAVLGKNGEMLHDFACGYDSVAVQNILERHEIKSIGNSTTPLRNMFNTDDTRLICYMLSEKVAYRLRSSNLMGKRVCVHIRDENLSTFERFSPLPCLTNNCTTIANAAIALVEKFYDFKKPMRSLGIRVTDLHKAVPVIQYSLYEDVEKIQKQSILENVSDSLKYKYGKEIIKRAVVMTDTGLFDFKNDCNESTGFSNMH